MKLKTTRIEKSFCGSAWGIANVSHLSDALASKNPQGSNAARESRERNNVLTQS